MVFADPAARGSSQRGFFHVPDFWRFQRAPPCKQDPLARNYNSDITLSTNQDSLHIVKFRQACDHGGEVYVYRRAGRSCHVCGGEIRTAELAARNLFWCPDCQKA